MPISDEKKLIFVHIPKNAGTSIENHLKMRETGHKVWFVYRDRFPNEWQNYTSFAVVRNPIDRFVSCYRYARMEKSYWHNVNGQAVYGKHPDYDICAALDINTVVKEFVRRRITLKHRGWLPQFIWVCDAKYAVMVNRIIRYEALSSELAHANICEALPKINWSDGDVGELTDETVNILRAIYKFDYEIFAL